MDFYIDKGYPLGLYKPNVLDLHQRSTTVNDKSPRINGVLKLQENAYHTVFRRKTGTTCNYGIGNAGTPYIVPGFNDNPYVSSELDYLIDNAVKQATEAAYSKVANIQMSLAEAISERASTIKVILQRAKQIKAIWLLVLKGQLPPKGLFGTPKWKKKKSLNLSVSELWLEYSFMWAPLLQDIETLINGLTPINGIYVKGGSTVSGECYNKSGYCITHSSRKVRCSVKLYVKVEDPLVAFQSELGLLTPVSAWNIMPFSFVVDWFFHVGAFLERICTPGKTVTSGSTTTLIKDRAFCSGQVIGLYYTYPDGTQVWFSNAGSGVTHTIETYNRTIGVPSPWFLTTDFSNFGWWKAGTTWALLSSIFTKKV